MAALAGLVVGALARPGLAAAGWWTLGLFVEGLIMALAALFFALALPGAATSALACLGFYALGRVIGLLGGIAAAHDQTGPLMWMLDRVIGLLALVLPRLDLLNRSVWLVHGVERVAEIGPALLQGGIYGLLLAAAASFDFSRRQL